MRINLIKTATGSLAIVSLLVCPLVSSKTTAMPSGSAFKTTSLLATEPLIRTQTRPTTLDKTTVLAKNSSAKTETVTTTTAPKEKKIEEKKTISRCWSRLMNMAREIRHAHTSTSK
ncbi:hypothetical protein [Spirosoma pollinicola]|uniref:hypothetical protein n=1 Tax=Spirosoma pollinicola TaxID=2057025 RepID=UPI0012FE0969|nr:hypothetical protein [Spirosoma pollinicola]